jgi:hypothetical protein
MLRPRSRPSLNYMASPLGLAFVVPATLTNLVPLEHFYFWCIQSNRSQRGFSSRKAAPSRAYLCRVEVKML